jgi:aryl-alcohol dehydrogenase
MPQWATGVLQKLYELNFSGRRPEGTTPLTRHGEELFGVFFGQSSMANYCLASARNTVKVDASVPLELLGPLGCGVQTGAGAVLNSLRPQAGSSIAIFGVGAVGLSAIMAAKLVGCTPILAGRRPAGAPRDRVIIRRDRDGRCPERLSGRRYP